VAPLLSVRKCLMLNIELDFATRKRVSFEFDGSAGFSKEKQELVERIKALKAAAHVCVRPGWVDSPVQG